MRILARADSSNNICNQHPQIVWMEIPDICLSLWDAETLYCADAVAYCTHEPVADLFVCGTYQLQESEDDAKSSSMNKRLGCLHLYRITEGKSCSLLQTVVLAGVLDAKWTMLNDSPFLAAALASGQIGILKLDNGKLTEVTRIDSSHDDGIALALDCSAEESRILASDSKGYVSLLDIVDVEVKPVQDRWKAHDHEVWAIAIGNDKNVAFTGGDDCLFKMWDIRNHQQPQLTNRRHTMGVTCITTCKKSESHLVTGSYDEKIRFWDTRNLKNPLVERETGGGVWRLKWDSNEEYLLSACMHNGFLIFDANLLPKARYAKHKSLAYGADWVRSTGQSKVAVTCSFYDRSLHMWSVIL